MGLTERHWFEDEEPELTDRQLEAIAYESKKAYDNGYVKGFHDAKTLEEHFVELGVKIGFLTPEKAEQLLKDCPQIVRCKNCKWYSPETSWCNNSMSPKEQTFFCADGKRRSE